MAKFGEGDKRWIVEDRPDGTNVHNWHWSETDCLEWSKSFLSNLLSNQTLTLNPPNDNLNINLKNIEKCDGEAYVNIRKGKIIPGYELSVQVSFEAKESGCEDKVDGFVELPYISDENADEDPELRVVVKEEGELGRRVKKGFLESGKGFVLEKVRAYVTAMASGGPAVSGREELEVKKVVKKSDESSGAVFTEKKAEEKKRKKKGKEGFKTISMTERFSCRAEDMFEILMDENRWKGFTQSNAKISKEVGGEFSIFDGSVTGINVELEKGKLIVQKWRFGSWNDGVHSMVRLVLDEPEPGVTIVKLTHTDVPEEDRYGNSTVVENTERGWRDLIFQRIRAVFGFGM